MDFSEKFTFSQVITVGEYSFSNNSFPIVRFDDFSKAFFSLEKSVNRMAFNWSVPMSENDASAFVRSRNFGTGTTNREVVIRITYSVVNTLRPNGLGFFVYHFEIFADNALTNRLAIATKTNTLSPSTVKEWSAAVESAQTATKEIGKYQLADSEYRVEGDGKIRNPRAPQPKPRRLSRSVTLTDIGLIYSNEQPDGSYKTDSSSFFATNYPWGHSISQSEINNQALQLPIYVSQLWRMSGNSVGQRLLEVTSSGGRVASFETIQERDRFFVDYTKTLLEWKARYSPFQFAAAKVEVFQQCENGDRFFPCESSTPYGVWQTESYRISVASLERNATNYIANLIFENITDKTISVGLEGKSSLSGASGPFLVDDSGEKYAVVGKDSANIITNSFAGSGTPVEIPAKTSVTSRFVFSGGGEAKKFRLEAKTSDWPGGKRITIEGLNVRP